jgi:hypothetical protein
MESHDESEAAAALNVVSGQPTTEELAALVAVIASRGGDDAGEFGAPRQVSGWTERARYVRGRLPHSPEGWRASGLPR